jgi:hypothetical protein
MAADPTLNVSVPNPYPVQIGELPGQFREEPTTIVSFVNVVAVFGENQLMPTEPAKLSAWAPTGEIKTAAPTAAAASTQRYSLPITVLLSQLLTNSASSSSTSDFT